MTSSGDSEVCTYVRAIICRTALAVALTAIYAAPYQQALAEPGPGLTTLTYQNDVETASADANQAAFSVLESACNGDGLLDRDPSPQYSQIDPSASSDCTEEAFAVYLVTRELVHTANEIQGEGPTISSLGLDLEGLGLALRWTAAEEFAAQTSMATDFANGQLSNLASRMSALRFGAGGFSVGLVPVNSSGTRVAGIDSQRGGGASADEGETYSPWGGFLNGAFGWGTKAPTPQEDAFDFDGSEVTVGIDYRFSNNIVVGGILGYSEQTVDFDASASAESVVDGGIESDGFSYIGFALYQGEKLSASASIGFQELDYDSVRKIKYASFNPDLSSVNATTLSSPESSVVMGTLSAAYAFQVSRLTIEPYLNAEYVDIDIDEFTEDRSTNSLSSANSRSFSLIVGKQTIQTFDTAIGLKILATLTPSFAVIVPYAAIEAHRESQDDVRAIAARYVGLDVLNPTGFNVATDPADDSYTKTVAGMSMVLRGGRQRTQGGAIFGGLQGFVQYSRINGLDNYDDEVISGGLRYEF